MLRDIAYMLFRSRWQVLSSFGLIFGATILFTLLSPPLFRSEAQIMIRLGRESVAFVSAQDQVVSIREDREHEINSGLAILRSRQLAEGAVAQIGAEKILHRPSRAELQSSLARCLPLTSKGSSAQQAPEQDDLSAWRRQDRAVQVVRKGLSAESRTRSNILHLSFQTQSPQLAQQLLWTIIKLYMARHIVVHARGDNLILLREKLLELRETLEHREEALRLLKDQEQVLDLKEQKRALVNRLSGLRERLGQDRAERAAAQASLSSLEAALENLPKTIVTEHRTGIANSAADGMRLRLYELELREQELLSKYKKSSRIVRDLQEQLAKARALLEGEERSRSEQRRGPRPAHSSLSLLILETQAQFMALEAGIRVLKEEQQAAEERLLRLNSAELKIKALERELEPLRGDHRRYVGALEQARVEQAQEQEKRSNLVLVETPSCPAHKLRPRTTINLIIGFILGIFGAVVVAYTLEFFNNSFRRPEELSKYLELPALSSTPQVPTQALQAAPWAQTPSLQHAYGELRERLLALEPQAQTLLLTACRPEQGVSTLARGLAHIFSQSGQPCILLELQDGSGEQPFLTERLEQGELLEEILKRANIAPNLDLFTPICPRALVESPHFEALLKKLRARYELILFDAPSLSEPGATARLASRLDGSLLIVQAESISREAAQALKARLDATGAQILGAVLSQRCMPIPDWIYRRL